MIVGRIATFAAMALTLGSCIAPARRLHAAVHGAAPVQQTGDGWPSYGGQPAQDHYSSLSQINRENVKRLKIAWTFDTGEKGSLETTPVIVGSVLYTYTPSLKVVALDAASGKLLWTFDSGVHEPDASRGVSYWTDGKESRLFAGMRNLLYALDPATGKPIKSFGEGGFIDLRKELRGDYTLQSIGLTSPGAVYKDLIIVGGRDPETPPAPPGDIRAFDVHTGALRWRFHTIPHPGEPGYDTWPKNAWKTAGAANNWAGMALDVKRGIVYVPTGSAVFDFYGGDRVGNDLFANSMLALDAETGRLLWYFQGVHHDLWDRDFPSPPALITVRRNGKSIDAVAQTTKQGWVFVFDRTNGQPLFPIEERKVPPEHCAGGGDLAHATGAALACAVYAPGCDRRYAYQSNAAGTRCSATAVSYPRWRAAICSRRPGQGDHPLSRRRWRRGMGWIGCRSEYRRHLHQCQSSCFHHHAGQERSLSRHWPADVSQPVRGLSWHRPFRRSSGLPFARGCIQPAYGGANYRHHPSGQRKNVLFSQPSRCGAGCLARVSPDWKRHGNTSA